MRVSTAKSPVFMKTCEICHQVIGYEEYEFILTNSSSLKSSLKVFPKKNIYVHTHCYEETFLK